MSRCFPYPPPGYSVSRAGNEALIESIKLLKEREKSNEERKKEKRREKKGKRKEKKKEKTNENSGGKSHNVDNASIGENIWMDSMVGLLHKERKAEIEQLERSGLTEEHGQPVCSRIPSSSSDSTENSNKRKRHALSVGGSNSLGNIIKIRLPSRKIEPDASFDEPQLCSTSGRMDIPVQLKDETALRASRGTVCSTSQGTHNHVQGVPARSDKELVFSASRQTDAAAHFKLGTSFGASTALTPMQRLELQYKNLVENWVPLDLHTLANDLDDQEWLFQRKDKDVCAERRIRSSADAISCSSNLALWPQSRSLSDADICALPYVVPF